MHLFALMCRPYTSKNSIFLTLAFNFSGWKFPRATKYICSLYRSPNSNNHELLFDHLSKSFETITLQSPRSEIIVLGDFNIHNSDWLSYSSNVTNPACREAEAFDIVNDLTQVISEPTRVLDRALAKANTLDLFLTANPSIYSPPTVSSPLGNSDYCLITLRHDFLPHLDRHFAPQRVFHYSKADCDSPRSFYSSYPWSSGSSNDPSSLASLITNAILLGMDIFIPSYKPGKKNSPKWFNSQCAKSVNNKNHYFKEWKRVQTQHSRTSFIQSRNTCSKTIKNAKSSFFQRINNKIASCQAGSCSFWSMAKVVSHNCCQSSFPPLKTTLTLLLPLLHPRLIFFRQSLPPTPIWTTKGSNLITFPLQNSLCHPLSSPHEKVRQTLLQLDTSKSKGPDGIPAIVLKACATELASILNKLFQFSYTLGIFPTPWK